MNDTVCIAQTIAVVAILVIQLTKIVMYSMRDWRDLRAGDEALKRYQEFISKWNKPKQKEE